ncbi:conjugal transfer protein [Metallosphaera tengchongensis]|uniref:Conjugal transfer protein n=1 Tax=Metallosphaera tengchongensis TaxID=1532350 RepID=A0A6N0NY84_9CREN|nr:conjugal transfer protein [Metallosphaera tengchongensis]QKR00338.1 conjugal transfer protein [Metallosphaera tengchongensis]
MGKRKKRSTFYNFVNDGEGFFEEAQAAYDRLQNKAKEVKNIRALEEKKIFSMSRAYEAYSKALLSTYGAIILMPVAILSIGGKSSIRFPRQIQEIESTFRELIKQATSPNIVRKKLSHDPIGGSKIVELLRASSELLRKLGQPELKNLFDEVNTFIKKPTKDRRYEDLSNLKKRITSSFRLRDLNDNIINLLRSCLLPNPNETTGYCKGLSDREKEIIKILLDKPYLLDEILSIMDLGLYALTDTLLYTAYLAHAAKGVAAYSEGRDENDEKYLEETRDHQKEMLENLAQVSNALHEISYNDEFDDFLADINEKARSLLGTDQDD